MPANLTVYKASAGSGKTYILSASYIARLLNGELDMHKRILAVTFTNKATTEMKERILQYLWDLANNNTATIESLPFYRTVRSLMTEPVDAETVKERAGKALTGILHDYEHFHIMTIDAFFQSLLSNLAHELGLSAGFKVDLNDKDVIGKAVERLISELPDNKKLQDWVLAYVRQRIDDSKRWDISDEVKHLAYELMKERFMVLEDDVFKRITDEEALDRFSKELSKKRAMTERFLSDAAKAVHESIANYGNGYGDISNGSRTIGSYLARLMEGSPVPPSEAVRKMIDGEKEWLKKSDKNKTDLIDHMNEVRDTIGRLETERQTAAKIISSCSLTLKLIKPLRLLGEINKVIGEINNENNRFMLAKTPLLFNRLVDGEDSSFVFEKAGTTFRHILIDEFQDTSALQWGNMKKLLLEKIAYGNGCLLVGDVKQGIYRFRGGDWQLLENIQNEFAHSKPEVKVLKRNFRSSNAVVEFNNTFFTRAARLLDQRDGGGRISLLYDDVAQIAKDESEGRVRVKLSDEIGMLEDLTEQIRMLYQDGISYKDMAVLLRYKKSAAALLDYFSKEHPDIPLVSDEIYLLQSSECIQLIINSLRFLCDPTNTIALTCINRIFHSHIRREPIQWEQITTEEALPEWFRQNAPSLRETPLFELCEKLTDLFELESQPDESPYLYVFLDQVTEFLEENSGGLTEFLNMWDEKYYKKPVTMGDANGIRVLTIHKSKGLAFHTVLMPYCDWDLEKDRADDLLWCEPNAEPYNQLPIVPVAMGAGKQVTQSIYEQPYLFEHQQKRIENLNLLYVGFTRAEENLMIWSTSKSPDSLGTNSTVGDLISICMKESGVPWTKTGDNSWEMQTELAAPTPPKGNEKSEQTHPLKLQSGLLNHRFRRFVSQAKFRQSKEVEKFFYDIMQKGSSRESTNYLKKGNLLHAIFAQINQPDDINRTVDNFVAHGWMTGDEGEELKKWILLRITHPKVAEWFCGEWDSINECTILERDSEGAVKESRPDKVLKKKDRTVVIDYKFGKPKEEHTEQVERYTRLLRSMGYPHVEGYLWYVYSNDLCKC